jgi:hypothetical protein
MRFKGPARPGASQSVSGFLEYSFRINSVESPDLQQAISFLDSLKSAPSSAEGSRSALLSFVWLDTLCHYWPDRSTDQIRELRSIFLFLKTSERSRYLKQRRIISRKLTQFIHQISTA